MQGKNMIPVLKKLNIEAACIGNHDFDYGLQKLKQNLQESGCVWLLSNMMDKKTGKPMADSNMYHTVFDKETGIKIGYFSVGQEEWIGTLMKDVDVSRFDYSEKCQFGRGISMKLRDLLKCDFIVSLTHMRVPNDLMFSKYNSSVVDLSLGGHDHIFRIDSVDGLLTLKSGTDFRMFSTIDVIFFAGDDKFQRFVKTYIREQNDKENSSNDEENKIDKVTFKPGELVANEDQSEFYILPSLSHHKYVTRVKKIIVQDIPNLVADQQIQQYTLKLSQQLSKIQQIQIGYLGCDIDSRFSKIRTEPTNLSCFFADLVRNWCKTDLTIINTGTFRADSIIQAGKFRIRQINKIFPMGDEIIKIRITGQQLLQALQNGVSKFPALQGRFHAISGCEYSYKSKAPPGARVIRQENFLKFIDNYRESIKLTTPGLVFDEKSFYTISVKKFIFEGGDGYTVFTKGERIDETSEFLAPIIFKSFMKSLMFNDINEDLPKIKEALNIGKSIDISNIQLDKEFKCVKLIPINDHRIKKID